VSNEDWKLQVSIRTSDSRDSDMINIRANTADELSVLLEGISDYSSQVAATARMVRASYNVAPLGTPTSTADTTPSKSSAPTQVQGPSGTSNPTCIHGPRIWRSGVSKKNGQPYAFWSCPEPQGPAQCKPAN
jgi:hypothetical protein